MSRTRYVSLLGLAFGDCGKGLFTDYLTRATGAHTVVRFNGGAQAGHNVVLPDGRHHTFAQFGAGSFVPGVYTLLAHPVVVHPSALAVEAQALARVGVADALERLLIDARCRVITPFHQAAGRLREGLRGAQAHGTCGVGVGETVRFALAHAALGLTYGELGDTPRVRDKLHGIRTMLCEEFKGMSVNGAALYAPYAEEWALLNDAGVAERWLAQIAPVVRCAAAQPRTAIAERLALPGTVIFEGAQGVLLDEWRGFHPHTSWSTVSTGAVAGVLANAGIAAHIEHYGVLRAYLTRHGAGPLPTHDAALDRLAEPHNSTRGWQGAFRRGHPDGVLLRYALECVGPLDGLAVSHLDVFDRAASLRWCSAYRIGAPSQILNRVEPAPAHDLAYQSALTQRLNAAQPLYDAAPVTTPSALLARIEARCELPVCFTSHGATACDVQVLMK